MRSGLPRWPGWRHLPRDARDTLFLLAVIGWTVLPHLPRLPWWCGVLTALVLGWRALLAVGNAALPGRLSLIGVLIVAGVLTWWSHRTLIGKEAGVTLLVVLMALKTLELRARRDALVVFFLGFFLVLTNFLYSQSLAVAAAMLVSVWGLLTALVLAHMPVGLPPLRRAGALAARAALLGAPLMVVLFVLFPRFGPLWGVPQDTVGRTGLSGTMRMGGVAEVANDDSIALRIRFPDGTAPPPQALYFRGPVLSVFDGETWQHDPAAMLGSSVRIHGSRYEMLLVGQPLRYEMTLEPLRLPMLPLLEATPDTPEAAPQIEGWALSARADLTWRTDRLVAERLRFTAQAWPRYQYGPRRNDMMLREAVQLPPGFNPRTLAWALAMRQDPRFAKAEPRELANALLGHIRSAGFRYTLLPGVYGRDAIDEFWFDRKAGFCEHFAAAFVVLMRALDVPARVVTGYQGADALPVDGWMVVRQSNAHAWAEFWQPGVGWMRADPTAAVDPDRIDRGRALRPTPGLMAGALEGMSPGLLLNLRDAWEAMNNRWNQWVLSYSRTQQFDLLSRLGVSSPDWQDLGLVLVYLISGAALLGAAWAWWDRHALDPWQRLHGRIRQRLAALQVPAEPHHSPRGLAQQVRRALGARGEPMAQELEALDRLRYGPQAARRPEPGWWPRFVAAAAQARPSPTETP